MFMHVISRAVLGIAGLSALLAADAGAQTPSFASVLEGAKREGTLVVWVSSQRSSEGGSPELKGYIAW